MKWLRDVAGLRVWWDTSRLVAGDRLAMALPQAISNARAALFCVSRSWSESTWCEDEYNAALQERRADRRYRVIALRLDDSQIPTFLANARYLEMQTLQPEVATALLEALARHPMREPQHISVIVWATVLAAQSAPVIAAVVVEGRAKKRSRNTRSR